MDECWIQSTFICSQYIRRFSCWLDLEVDTLNLLFDLHTEAGNLVFAARSFIFTRWDIFGACLYLFSYSTWRMTISGGCWMNVWDMWAKVAVLCGCHSTPVFMSLSMKKIRKKQTKTQQPGLKQPWNYVATVILLPCAVLNAQLRCYLSQLQWLRSKRRSVLAESSSCFCSFFKHCENMSVVWVRRTHWRWNENRSLAGIFFYAIIFSLYRSGLEWRRLCSAGIKSWLKLNMKAQIHAGIGLLRIWDHRCIPASSLMIVNIWIVTQKWLLFSELKTFEWMKNNLISK